jgi:lysophospholipase L1-like esterase
MASPVADSYSVASGASVWAGRYPSGLLSGGASLGDVSAAGGMASAVSVLSGSATLDGLSAIGALAPVPSPNAVLVGDSLTAYGYGELHTFTGINALAGAPLRTIGNIGVASETVQQVLNRIDNSNTAASPGMVGFGTVGWAILRIGTNDTRGGASITGTVQTAYQNLIAKLLTYASRVIVMAVPPCGPNNGGNGAGVNSYDSWLSSYCAGVPNVDFINDTATVNDGSGGWATGYEPADGIHYSGAAAQRMTADGAAAFAALVSPIGYASPLITDPADLYPATTQWVDHPFMDGTGGSNSIGSGSVPTGWSVGAYGASFAATASIVAADGGDPNTTPWLRVTPTQVSFGTNGYLKVVGLLTGRTITTTDPTTLELVAQVRFNSFDSSRFSRCRAAVYGNGNEYMTPSATFFLGGDALSETIVLRTAVPRPNTKLASTDATFEMYLVPDESFAGSMGSFDIRCVSVRG